MTADAATIVVPRVGLRLWALAVVGSLLSTAAVHVGSGTPERQSPPGRAGLETLPLAAQGPISAAVGRDLPGYRVVRLAAHNAAQGFDVRFSQTGATVAAGPAKLGMTLSAYGYGSSLRSVAPVAPHANANRVSYAHGALTEWWANGPLGLEQGFDIASRPSAGSGP